MSSSRAARSVRGRRSRPSTSGRFRRARRPPARSARAAGRSRARSRGRSIRIVRVVGATPERSRGEEPGGEALCDLGEERQRRAARVCAQCRRPTSSSRSPRSPCARGAGALAAMLRRLARSAAARGCERRASRSRSGTPAAAAIGVSRAVVCAARSFSQSRSLDELERRDRREPISVDPCRTRRAAGSAGRHRRASSRRAADRRCAGCTPRATRPARSGRATARPTGSPGVASTRYPRGRQSGARERRSEPRPQRSREPPSVAHPPASRAATYSRCRRTSYTPAGTGNGSCSSCTSEHRLAPRPRTTNRRPPQPLSRDAPLRRRRRARDRSPPPQPEQADGRRSCSTCAPAARPREPAAGHPAGSAHGGPNHRSLISSSSFSGLPEPDRVTCCHRAAEAGWRRDEPALLTQDHCTAPRLSSHGASSGHPRVPAPSRALRLISRGHVRESPRPLPRLTGQRGGNRQAHDPVARAATYASARRRRVTAVAPRELDERATLSSTRR